MGTNLKIDSRLFFVSHTQSLNLRKLWKKFAKGKGETKNIAKNSHPSLRRA